MSKAMSRFAHLVGIRARAEEPEDDDQTADNNDPDHNADNDDQNPDAAEPEDPKDQNGRAKGKKAKRAKAEDDQDPDAENEGDDVTDAEDEEDDTTAKARARERGRCAAIFSSKAAASNLALAAELAFGSNLPRSQAVRILNSGAVSKQSSSPKPSKTNAFDARMARSRQVLGMDVQVQQSQNLSKSAMQANQILLSAKGTGVVKKEPRS